MQIFSSRLITLHMKSEYTFDMKRFCTILPTFSIIAILLFLFLVPAAEAQRKATYDSIGTLTAGMSMSQISDLAEKLDAEGKTDQAIAAYSQASNMFDRHMNDDDMRACVQAHMNLSRLWINKGNLINALQVLMNALDIAENIHDDALTLRILNNMGYIYLTFGHYEEAAEYYTQAENLNRKFNDPDADFLIYNNLASVYAALGDNAKAKHYLGRLRHLKVRDNRILSSAPYYTSLLEGIILNNDRQYQRGINSIRKAIDYAGSNSLGDALLCFAYEELYKSYAGKKDIDSTLWALNRYYDHARKAPMPEKEVTALREIYRIHEEKGDSATAMKLKAEYLTLADSVMNFREFARLNSVRIVHETSRYRSEIAALNTDSILKKQRIRRLITVILGISCVLVVIVILLVVVHNQKKKLRLSYEHLFKIHTAAMKAQRDEKKHETVAPERKETKYAGSNLQENEAARLADAIRNIMDNTDEPCSPDFSVQKLAELTGSNSRYVSQVINDRFGMNFSALLNNSRIQKAKERLADIETYGNQTIQSIAAGVGYRNQTSFISAFKKAVGMTPSIFLKIARQEATKEKRTDD